MVESSREQRPRATQDAVAERMLRIAGNDSSHYSLSRRGADIMQQLNNSKPEQVTTFEKQSEDNFFGSPHIDSINVLDGTKIEAPKLQGKTQEMIKRSRDIAPILDDIAEAFTGFGYQVHRMPLLFGGPEAVTQKEQKAGQIAAYPMLTYNNVLIEQTKKQHTVYLPFYGIKALDETASTAWKKLGYQVKPIPGFAISSMYGGALRCSVKVLKRSLSD